MRHHSSCRTFTLLLMGLLSAHACGRVDQTQNPSTTGGSGGSGGAQPTGGSSTGGLPNPGASTSTGGTTATGGIAGAGSARADASATTCSCADDGTTSWDCYCSVYVYNCGRTLGAYMPDVGTGSTVIAYEEYANCNLAVVTTVPDFAYYPLHHVFELSTGRLVGDETGTDMPTICPFGSGATMVQKLGAGVLYPDPTCVRSKCVGGGYLTGTTCSDAGV